MLATDGPGLLAVTQSTPATTPAVVPEPAQPSTLTATSRTRLATPYAVPPMVPATWVPCPLQSVSLPSPVVLVPAAGPAAEVACGVTRIPVSMTYAVTDAAGVA